LQQKIIKILLKYVFPNVASKVEIVIEDAEENLEDKKFNYYQVVKIVFEDNECNLENRIFCSHLYKSKL
jgi:hypothetical protein